MSNDTEPQTAENRARLYVLPDRWDHAIGAALRFARRDGLRYQVRWFPPRGCWVVSRASGQTPAGGAS